ncbi:MATE efflux family protein 3, chloroplastic [Morella rubra]|uniref:Protein DETOXIFICATION n=1 Tax=Morella rubra TaxID=262757 RepID=A0A6A1V2Y8_9ROSI|nr:MATE efflux family protein 3, chloroplastic [Morella rubra]
MTVTRLSGSLSCDFSIKRWERRSIKKVEKTFVSKTARNGGHVIYWAARGLSFNNVARRCWLIREQQTSDYELSASGVEDCVASENGALLSEKISEVAGAFTTSQSRPPNVQTELIMLSFPAMAGQAIEPLAQLMETAYIGRLGPLELASAGLSMSIFNIISKVFNIPLLSVATSFVAEDISRNASKGSNSGLDDMSERKLLPSVSTALLLAVVIGILEALAMYLGSGLFLSMMGISPASSMRIPSEQFLSLRAIGAPAVVVSLAIQGIFRGFKDTQTPVFNIPLLSVATSFVAEDISRNASKGSNSGLDDMSERKLLPSVSTALLLAVVIGILEALAMYLGSGLFLSMMGISPASSMRIPSEQFLSLRAIGAPAVVVSLAIQGIFRGFKDTQTPVLCLGKYIVTFLMIWYLNKRTVLSLPSVKTLHFGGYLRSGGFLLGRTLAAVLTITLSTSMAARLGPLAMAAHQICLQVWLSVSLLADAQAASGQALIASSYAKGDYSTVKEITYFALKTGLFTGISLAVILGISFGFLARLFTNDSEVLQIVRSGLLFVSASQPINALAYIFDGLHYGISDFSYAACSMIIMEEWSLVVLAGGDTQLRGWLREEVNSI